MQIVCQRKLLYVKSIELHPTLILQRIYAHDTIYQAFQKMLKLLTIILILNAVVGTLQNRAFNTYNLSQYCFRHLIFTPFFQIFSEYLFQRFSIPHV